MTLLLSVALGLLSMLAYGFANAFSKPLAQKLGAPQTLFLRGLTLVSLLAVAAIPSYHNLSHWQIALAAILLGMAGYLPVLAFTHGIKESPLGIMAPISGTSPLITVLLSWLFLSLHLSSLQWLAITIVVGANIAISVNPRNWRNSSLLRRSTGVPYALMAAVGWGLFFFLFVPLSRSLGPWLATLLAEIGVTLAAGLHARSSGRTPKLSSAFQPAVIGNGLLVGTGTLAFAIGASQFNVAIVATLSNSTALISSLLGVWLFREQLGAKEKIAGAVMIGGVAALSLL